MSVSNKLKLFKTKEYISSEKKCETLKQMKREIFWSERLFQMFKSNQKGNTQSPQDLRNSVSRQEIQEEEPCASRKRSSHRTCLPRPKHGNGRNCLFHPQRKSNTSSKMITYCILKYRFLTCHQKCYNHVVCDFNQFSKHTTN